MRSRLRSRARSGHLLGLAVLTALWVQACTKENVTGVTVQEIAVLPPSVTVLRDESVQLVAEVRDEEGRLLETANVTWTSDRPSVVSVSPDGLVRAIGVGPATVRASVGGVAGSASVTVMSPALLRAEPESVTLRGAVGAGPPGPAHVDIRDQGEEVKDLEASLAYAAGSESGWLQARLRDDESPTTLEVSAETAGMSAGAYTASVLVSGRETRGSPIVIPVTLTLAGIAVVESDGRTLVSGSGGSDEVTVRLMLRPERDVVVRATSNEPEIAVVSPTELRFTPQNWDAPQTIRVTAGSGGGGGWFGYRVTDVEIAVETGASDPVYAPVPAKTLSVAVLRSPFR